jgi:hypothetical protein
MERSVERNSVPPIVLGAAPAALATLVGVVALGLMTTPARPYVEGRWAPVDLFGLIVLALAVGFFNRSLIGLLGTVVGATAAIAVQLFVLAEQASWSPDVVTSLRADAWPGQVLGALVTGLVTLAGGYLVGASAGVFVRPSPAGGSHQPPANRRQQALVALATLGGATLLLFVLVQDAATSAYVPRANAPILLVSVQGQRILTVAPETIGAGRIIVDTNRTGAGAGASHVWLDGPLSDRQLAILQSGIRPVGESAAELLPYGDDLIHHARQMDLGPGLYAVVVAELPFELTPEAPVRALDARTIVIGGPEPADRQAGSGPLVVLGFLLALAVAGWGTAGSLLISGRVPNGLFAVIAGVLAAGILWLAANSAISQSHGPF